MVNQAEFSVTPELNAIQASVVLLSPAPIDPQSTNPETLKSAGIVPQDWAVANSINLPFFYVLNSKMDLFFRRKANDAFSKNL